MRNSLIAAVALAALTIGSAHATEFDFTYTGSDGLAGVVQVFGNEIAPNNYMITSGTDVLTGGNTAYDGTFTLIPDTAGFAPNDSNYLLSPNGDFYYDNMVTTAAGVATVDYWGLLFGDHAGNEVNLYSNNGQYIDYYNTAQVNEPVTIGNVSVPEPASVAMFGLGLLGLGLIRRREGWLGVHGDAGTVV
jgi:hypothetical protein